MLTVFTVKNVYASFAYGSRNGSAVYNPYAQLMPITNVVDAHNDWVNTYNKWGGNSTQPSSVSLPVQSTPKSSSLSTSPYPSSSSLSPHPPSSSSPSPHPPSPPSPSTSTSSSSPSPSTSSSSSSPSPSTSSSSSAPNPLATGANDKITGAVEGDNDEEKSDPVRHFLFLQCLPV